MELQDFRKKFQNHVPGLQSGNGRYAVLVPLVRQPEGLCLLYEVRASQLRAHASEVCFPGGRMEPGETPTVCALRETQEELGIAPESVEILGQLDFLYLRQDGLMYPVLGHLDHHALERMQYNPAEVKDTFLVPLSYLQSHPPRLYQYQLEPQVGADFPYHLVQTSPDYHWRPGHMEVPVYEGLPYPLWGLTARITFWLLRTMDTGGDR